MKKLYLARHAQTESNTGQKIDINEHIALTQLGHAQADELASWCIANVSPIDSVLVSSYHRTHQTAKPLLDKLDACPTIVPDLHEFNALNFATIKDLDFLQLQQVAEHHYQTATPDYIDGNGLDVPDNWKAESFNQFVQRVKNVIEYFKQLPDGNYVVITHGIWLSMLRWLLLNEKTDNKSSMQKFRQFELAIRPKNCEVFCLTIDNNLMQCQKVRFRNDDDGFKSIF